MRRPAGSKFHSLTILQKEIFTYILMVEGSQSIIRLKPQKIMIFFDYGKQDIGKIFRKTTVYNFIHMT